MTDKVRVLFVCLGNICRSPSAEGVFQSLVDQSGLSDRVEVDSCGTGSWHVGKTPDARAIQAARKRGIDIGHLRARQFVSDDLARFDHVLVMDRQNLTDVTEAWHRCGGTRPELFLDYGQSAHREVPDPYYGGEDGFELVLDLIHEAGEGLLADIRERLS
ncbi:low molecular weight protein-tyrosine-phosphatase [Marinobacter sp. F4216]|uniref:low molecular weight protein-tyrosine-phosphatase n=1 Tax=Marinobacter sp. F4216 TaxID=2874281 RepID=UPI001CBBC58D|nr:low molecular weight protein-tyrosine-phosphatase [Marinobacter sp. F4216]MBZ2167794.1 low molecular weight phosphotyrosine protein phosphatase [Marinobacter sp. F4216]